MSKVISAESVEMRIKPAAGCLIKYGDKKKAFSPNNPVLRSKSNCQSGKSIKFGITGENQIRVA
jgi:hypothetical protein